MSDSDFFPSFSNKRYRINVDSNTNDSLNSSSEFSVMKAGESFSSNTTNMTEFAFQALVFRNSLGYESIPIRLCSERNMLSPPWPNQFWSMPVFTGNGRDIEAELELSRTRNRAAAVAIENLQSVIESNSESTTDRLRPLEKRVRETAEALSRLERAAAVAETADATSEIVATKQAVVTQDEADGNDDLDFNDSPKEVQVVKNDPVLRYDTNLQSDVLAMVYASKGLSTPIGISMGMWYRTLQESMVAERPNVARKIDYQNGRTSRTFILAAIAAEQSTGRLYIGARHYSAFEAAALCLFVHSAGMKGSGALSPPKTFVDLISEIPKYLDDLHTSIIGEVRLRYGFESSSLPKSTFSAPGSGRYEKDALSGHAILDIFVARRTLPPPPGALPKDGVSAEVDKEGNAYDDPVNRAAAALLARAQPLMLMEDQTLLRSTINTITALLFLRRLLWNTDVYADRTKNNFQLGSFLYGATDAHTTVGATGGPKGVIKSDNRNFAFLIHHYVVPYYSNDNSVELTQMFPGLVVICLEAAANSSRASFRGTRRRVVDVSVAKAQASLVKLIGVELENRGKSTIASVKEVIEIHDAVTIQYEKGLAVAMIAPRFKELFFESGKAANLNIASDYDLHYFICLGYIPKFTSAI